MTEGIEVMDPEEAEAAEWERHARAVRALTDALLGLVARRGFPPGAAVDAATIASWLLLRTAGLPHGEIAAALRGLVDRLEDDPPELVGADLRRLRRGGGRHDA